MFASEITLTMATAVDSCWDEQTGQILTWQRQYPALRSRLRPLKRKYVNDGIAATCVLLLWINARCSFWGNVVLVLLANTENKKSWKNKITTVAFEGETGSQKWSSICFYLQNLAIRCICDTLNQYRSLTIVFQEEQRRLMWWVNSTWEKPIMWLNWSVWSGGGALENHSYTYFKTTGLM